MAIKTIQSAKLRRLWEWHDLSVLPGTYRFEVENILFDLDAAQCIDDLRDIGAIQYDPQHADAWSVTVTVNNVEPCAAVTCHFWQGDVYNLDLREYNP
ncbi:hypothetical protein P2G88_13005 [Aliiglaciecola sp. CAU 1673]|uniref:hypothetical protein n=1 Tax=Aliiglaciecola sp. CAU 1673 TaxID=3032595 RepID=UPI0023DA85AF|nr:hypothetical protein [Aliiglaciecola sp. CAU 1673]MDF2179172.1 hypothetical protein [Aliiglaciecola sp. CAU 1673]